MTIKHNMLWFDRKDKTLDQNKVFTMNNSSRLCYCIVTILYYVFLLVFHVHLKCNGQRKIYFLAIVNLYSILFLKFLRHKNLF